MTAALQAPARAGRPPIRTHLDPDAIPPELKALDQWTCWRAEWNDDRQRWEKRPCSGSGRVWAAQTDPSSRLSFAAALAAHEASDQGLGMGFVLTPGDPFVAVDLDHAISDDGEIAPWASEVLKSLGDTYAEISPSGRGIRAFVRGNLPDGCRHKRGKLGSAGDGALEVYEHKRFVTVTGAMIGGSAATIAEAGRAFFGLLDKLGLLAPPVPHPAVGTRPGRAGALGLDDSALLDKARSAKNGHRFRALFDQGELIEGDWSRSDLSLVRHLAFWCGPDRARIDKLFRISSLMRQKWDARRGGQTYGDRTIDRALARTGPNDLYKPPAGSRSTRLRIAATPAPDGTPAPGPTAEAVDDPHRLARGFIDRSSHEGRPTLACYRGEFWRWGGQCWKVCQTAEIRAELGRWVKREFDDAYARGDDRRLRPVTRGKITDVAEALASLCLIREADAPDLPAWIGEHPPGWDARDVLPCRNALVHLPSLVGGADDYRIDLTPALFASYALGFDFDAAAPRPVEWLKFLGAIWPDDPESIETLQDWFGYCLTQDTSHQKALMIIGPPRSGKGTIARAQTGLLGAENVCSPTLAALCTNFGAAPLIAKMLAIIADARISGKADTAVAVERILSITGEDDQTIDRKYRPAWSGRLPTRLMLHSNETPALLDASTALANRFVVLRLGTSFLGQEDRGLESRIRAELPGILLWAIEGRRRLTDRGYFLQPASGLEIMKELEAQSSPVTAFIADRCVVGPGREIVMSELYAAWRSWCQEQGRDHPGTQNSFGRQLRAALPDLQTATVRRGSTTTKVYRGVDLDLSAAGESPF